MARRGIALGQLGAPRGRGAAPAIVHCGDSLGCEASGPPGGTGREGPSRRPPLANPTAAPGAPAAAGSAASGAGVEAKGEGRHPGGQSKGPRRAGQSQSDGRATARARAGAGAGGRAEHARRGAVGRRHLHRQRPRASLAPAAAHRLHRQRPRTAFIARGLAQTLAPAKAAGWGL